MALLASPDVGVRGRTLLVEQFGSPAAGHNQVVFLNSFLLVLTLLRALFVFNSYFGSGPSYSMLVTNKCK